MLIKDNFTVLFQGDSVTDAGRSYEDDSNLGWGYPMLISSWFTALYPEKQVKFINRGVSGNRVVDLQSRWDRDCIDVKPDVVTILIGINDCWRKYDSNDPTSAEKFEAGYRDLLTQIKEKLSGAKIILMEPFVLPIPEDRADWRVDLDPKIHVARKLAREFDATLVPLDGIFAQAAAKAPLATWAADGVHPTQAGHALISEAWLKAVKAL